MSVPRIGTTIRQPAVTGRSQARPARRPRAAMLASPSGAGGQSTGARGVCAARRHALGNLKGSDTMTDTPAPEDREPTPAPDEAPPAAEGNGDPAQPTLDESPAP